MSLTPFETYKDSGVSWLGNVPAHWEVKRLRFAMRLNPSKGEIAELSRATEVSFLPMESIGDDGSINTEQVRAIGEVESGYTYFREGDVAFAKITPCFENGKGAVMRELLQGIGFGTTELTIARPISGEITSDYLYWIFTSVIFRSRGAASMYGAGGQKRVPDDFVRDFVVPLPPLAEQSTIQGFLASETGKIDSLISEQRRLIELLKETRRSTIFRAVTSGLDANVSMKRSEIAWLPSIPEHWDILRLGALFRETAEPGNEDLPVLSVSIHDGVSDREFDDDELDRKVIRSEDRGKYKQVKVGDLVYNMMRAWQGGFGSVTVAGMVSPAYVVARPLKIFSTEFVEQLLRTPPAIEELRRYSHGVTDFRLRLYWNEFKLIKIPLPPVEEQREIMAFLERETSKFDALGSEAENAIRLLQERRAALIAGAVTGKIDVRGQATLPHKSKAVA